VDQPPTSAAPAPGQQPDPNRVHQMFPVLNAADMQRIRRFGEPHHAADGSYLIQAGMKSRGLFLLIKGRVDVTQRDGLGNTRPYHDYFPGEFLAEAGTLFGGSALVDAQCVGEVEGILVVPDQLRALIIAEADLGERIMRALILRRVSLIQAGASGATLIGAAGSASVLRLQNFLQRNGRITWSPVPTIRWPRSCWCSTGPRRPRRWPSRPTAPCWWSPPRRRWPRRWA